MAHLKILSRLAGQVYSISHNYHFKYIAISRLLFTRTCNRSTIIDDGHDVEVGCVAVFRYVTLLKDFRDFMSNMHVHLTNSKFKISVIEKYLFLYVC